jgi:hypothetical protein
LAAWPRTPADKAFTWLGCALAFILFAAALAKCCQLAAELVDWAAMTGDEYFQLLVVAMELAVAMLLMSGRMRHVARFAAFGLFAVFTAVNLYLVVTGEPSCGCFGKVPISPVVTLILDLAILVGLALFRPKYATSESSIWRSLAPPALAGAAVSVVLVGTSLWFGSLQAAVAQLGGQSLSAYPTVSRIGAGEMDARRELKLTIWNHDSISIQLLGAKQNCNFFVADKLPLELAPGEQRELRCVAGYVSLHKTPRFRHSITLYTSSKSAPMIHLEVNGVVIEPSRNPSVEKEETHASRE